MQRSFVWAFLFGLLLLVIPHWVLAHALGVETGRANALVFYYVGCAVGAGCLNIWTRNREWAAEDEDHTYRARWRSFVSGEPPRRAP